MNNRPDKGGFNKHFSLFPLICPALLSKLTEAMYAGDASGVHEKYKMDAQRV